jgi:ABC-type Fe3+-hydroxamate transport system substrate-binding protein
VLDTDAPIPSAPQRIVSLVPSLTEALFVLGLGDRVVGVTDWCIHPADGVAPLPKLGGTKNPDLERALGLRPDLVIANHEENTERVVRRFREAGVPVWVTYPRTAGEGAVLLREMAALGASERVFSEVIEPVEAALREAEIASGAHPRRFFCPIWRDPWMSVGADTFAHSMISLCGGENVFRGRAERRYPIVTLEEIVAAQPQVILLPDEPYAFGEADRQELLELPVPAAEQERIHLIDGTSVSWYGPRMRSALETLRPLFSDSSPQV